MFISNLFSQDVIESVEKGYKFDCISLTYIRYHNLSNKNFMIFAIITRNASF